MSRYRLFLAALFGGMAVTIGAMGAHGLEGYFQRQGLDAETIAKRIDQCEIGVRYQFYHALALLGLSVLPKSFAPRSVSAATFFIILGVVLFSGGLYMLSLLGILGHWAIVPAGGMSWIIAWTILAIAALLPDRSQSEK